MISAKNGYWLAGNRAQRLQITSSIRYGFFFMHLLVIVTATTNDSVHAAVRAVVDKLFTCAHGFRQSWLHTWVLWDRSMPWAGSERHSKRSRKARTGIFSSDRTLQSSDHVYDCSVNAALADNSRWENCACNR